MKKKYLSVLGLVGVAILVFSCKSGGDQTSTTTGPKRVSAADKAALKDLLRNADPTTYRLQFDGGKETMGSKKLTLAGVRRTLSTGSNAGALAFIVDGDGLLCDKGTRPLLLFERPLGQQAAAQVKAIAARYR